MLRCQPNRGLTSRLEATAMTNPFAELIAAEEAKREHNSDPKLRWKAIQETITWAEAQRTVRRNTPAACLAEQNRKLATSSASGSA
jgi:hypothetical protein